MKEFEGMKIELEKNAIGLLPILGGLGAAATGYGAMKGYSHYKAQKQKAKQLETMRRKANMFGQLTPRLDPKLMA